MRARWIMAAIMLLAGVADARAGDVGPRLDEMCRRAETLGFSGAVFCLDGDEVVLKQGYGLANRDENRPATPDTLFDIGSLTKQFTAAAILRLEMDGALKTSDTLDRFFPDLPPDKAGVTLHHLLTHTSGLSVIGSPMAPSFDESVSAATTRREELVDAFRLAPIAAPPGSRFMYSNAGYMLLAAVVEVAGEQPFETYLRDHLFAPAGMTGTTFCQDRTTAAPVAMGYQGDRVVNSAVDGWYSWGLRGAGGCLSTLNDLIQWERALRTHTILSAEATERLFTPFLNDYGYGWSINRTEEKDLLWINHGGDTRGFSAKYYRWPELNRTVVWLTNDRAVGYFLPTHLAFAAAQETHVMPPKAAEVDKTTLASMVGVYVAAAGVPKMRITRDDRGVITCALVETPRRADMLDIAVDDTRRLLLALDLEDVDMLEGYLAPRWDQYGRWADRALTYWRDEVVRMHGAVTNISNPEVGFDPQTDHIQTAVTLTHESGRRTRFGFMWVNGRLQGFQENPPWRPAGREVATMSVGAVPTDAQTLTLWDLPMMQPAGTLRFDGDAVVWTDADGSTVNLQPSAGIPSRQP